MSSNKLLLLFVLLFINSHVLADCYLVKEGSQILKKEGDCKTVYSPHSSFKIALSLMGHDSKILQDETHPSFPYKLEYDTKINVCKGAHNPRTWLRDSCVWFSQVITQKMGMEKFKEYTVKFDYGNKDVSGDKGKTNGLTQAWLGSSLLISPEQQIEFVQKLLAEKLNISHKSYQMTKRNLYRQELPGGWKLYGKTGNGRYQGELQHGWFVGWIEKDSRLISFVHHVVDKSKRETFASFRSKNEAITKLWYLINELEK